MTPKVLILTPYYYPVIGGVESNAERFARYLVSRGISTQVLTKRLAHDLPDADTARLRRWANVAPFGPR